MPTAKGQGANCQGPKGQGTKNQQPTTNNQQPKTKGPKGQGSKDQEPRTKNQRRKPQKAEAKRVKGPRATAAVEVTQMDEGIASCLCMKQHDWSFNHKPYDLRQRLLNFAVVIVRLVQFLHTQGPIAKALSYQILKCGTSAGANYEEADDGSSPRDKKAKRLITLRELKETQFRLKVLRIVGILGLCHDPILQENDELVRIVATIIRNTPDD